MIVVAPGVGRFHRTCIPAVITPGPYTLVMVNVLPETEPMTEKVLASPVMACDDTVPQLLYRVQSPGPAAILTMSVPPDHCTVDRC